MTLREYIIFWQETYDRYQSRSTTYAAHNYVFKNHILPGLGDVLLSELTSEMVGEFLEERKRFGNHRTGSSGLGEETMRHIHRLLQQCLDQAIRDGLISENPAKAIHYRKSTTVKANIMTPLEMEDYLDAAERLGYLPMFMLALTTGLRQGELLALKWSDLDIESRTLTIAENRAVVRRELVECGRQTRPIRLTPEVVDLLTMEHSKHPSSPLMFMHPATLKPYSPQMVRRMHNEIIKEAGIDHIRFTDLRHTCAILALKNGMDTKELAQMLGHYRPTITRQNYEPYLQHKVQKDEDIPDDRPPTRKQEQLIAKLVKDFPDSKTLYEYEDYLTKPTKVNASAFITLALEANWDAIHESDQYMKYIATRPRAECIGAHGLFGDDDAVSLEKAMEELESYTGNVWTHIISLKREDAARLGFDNAAAWRNLIRAHRSDIAAAMKIPPGDFRWYAAFHDEGEHPHIHMMAWSAKPGQAYLSKEGIRQIKSKLTNDIFRNEMLHLYEQKAESRDELVRQARRAMLELVQTMQDSMCDHPDAERLMLELAAQLETVKGKKSYGYLPKRLKKPVDEIVDEMERLPGVSKCYDQWLLLQGKVDSHYHDKPQKCVPLSKQKEFTQIKNAIIREAERLRLDEITFEEKNLNQQDEPEEYRNASYDYGVLRDVIRDESLTMEERGEAVSEMEKLAESGDMYPAFTSITNKLF